MILLWRSILRNFHNLSNCAWQKRTGYDRNKYFPDCAVDLDLSCNCLFSLRPKTRACLFHLSSKMLCTMIWYLCVSVLPVQLFSHHICISEGSTISLLPWLRVMVLPFPLPLAVNDWLPTPAAGIATILGRIVRCQCPSWWSKRVDFQNCLV